MYYIFVFRARSSAYKFYERLLMEGITASIISTPFLSKVGCSLSVRVQENYYDKANMLLAKTNPPFFIGKYYVFNQNGKIAYRKL